MEMRKTSRRRPRSVDGAELGHLTLLFYRVQKYIRHTDPNGKNDQNEMKRLKGPN